MTTLRQRMLEDMRVRNLAPKTQEAYLRQVSRFARYFNASPDHLGPEHIRSWLVFLSQEKKVSFSEFNVAVSALRFLYRTTLGQDLVRRDVPYPRRQRTIPVVCSQLEVAQFLAAVPSLSHRTLLETIYAAGPRISEVIRLRIPDIDSQRMVLVLRQAKGHKDRLAALSPRLLEHLRAYWRAERPTDWLFPGHRPGTHISADAVQVVFTLPDEVAAIALQNKRVVYNLLFSVAADTLRTIAADPKHLGADIGFLAVLHTWGQTLQHHPHLHCIVPGGGLSPDHSRFVRCRKGFFLPVKVLSRLFRGWFLAALRSASDRGELCFHGSLTHLLDPASFEALLASIRAKPWVVYAKRPFGGPGQVVKYLGQYTHRIAIAESRLVAIDEATVSFRWRDYRHEHRHRTMTLSGEEFLRRFLLHVLPRGFQSIRHVGLLSNRRRRESLALCRSLLDAARDPRSPPEPSREAEPVSTAISSPRADELCPVCGLGRMRPLAWLPLPDPPLPATPVRAPPGATSIHANS